MKINRIKIISFFLSLNAYAQVDTLRINDNKFIRLEFDSEIKLFQVSNPNQYFIENKGTFLFIQALEKDLKQSNLFVQTTEDKSYDFILEINSEISKLHYNYSKGLSGKNSHLSNESADLQINPLADKKGYIKSRNFSTKANMTLMIKGIYVKEDQLFFFFDIQNKSNINFELNDLNFSIVNEGKLKNTSVEREEIVPKKIYNQWNTIEGKSTQSFVVAFDKFTLTNRNFLVEILEKNGDRNLSLLINNKLIVNSKTL